MLWNPDRKKVTHRESRFFSGVEDEVNVVNQLFVAVVNDVVWHGGVLYLLGARNQLRYYKLLICSIFHLQTGRRLQL